MKTILITGAGGFLGKHLCAFLKKDHIVIGADLPGITPVDDIDWAEVNQEDGLAQIFLELQPDIVIHGAFINRKPADWTERRYLDDVLSYNMPLFAVCAAARAKLILISSSAVYGHGDGKGVIDETCPPQPVSLYGLAKSLQEMLAKYYAARGLRLFILRLFNLCGPGQKLGMLMPDWVGQAVNIAKGARPVMTVRNRATIRDFVDVRDAAGAVAMAINNFRPDEVLNVASGEAVSLLEISEELQRICPIPFELGETDPVPSEADIPRQCGSFERIKRLCGWEPRISWKKSLKDIWDEYLSQ